MRYSGDADMSRIEVMRNERQPPPPEVERGQGEQLKMYENMKGEVPHMQQSTQSAVVQLSVRVDQLEAAAATGGGA